MYTLMRPPYLQTIFISLGLTLLVASCTFASNDLPPSGAAAPAVAHAWPSAIIDATPHAATGKVGTTPTGATSTASDPTATIPAAAGKIALQEVAKGFKAPLYLSHAGDDSGRMFVVEKAGTIAILRDGARVDTPFLDITDVVGSSSSEQGLLSVAFHPDYRTNGLLFVDYTNKDGDTVIARYKVSSQPDGADPASAKILLTIKQPAANHNGGLVTFGPDGFLYIGMGDGGGAGDSWGNGQNTKVLLGKLLRIDVNNGDPYAIPQDNPFADGTKGRPEIWAFGLRNPWRYSFDRADGTLFIADVGQNKYEEINAQPANAPGLNYGWNITEGQECYNTTSCDKQNFAAPVAVYNHDQGCSVTGGYMYRGAAFPQLVGQYFFGDYCSGRIWSLTHAGNSAWQQQEVLKTDYQISSFGEDQAGELYLTDIGDGAVYQVTVR